MKRVIGVSIGLLAFGSVGFGLLLGQEPPKPPEAPPASGMPPAQAPATKAPEFPPFAEVTKEHEKIVSTIDGKPSLYTLWIRKKDHQLLAELPPDFAAKKYFIAMTVASGEYFAGLQAGDIYVYWKAYDKRLALVEPNVTTRSTGDPESQNSVKRLFTDRVI